MKIPREITSKILYLLDETIPPFLRDSKWFMFIPIKILFQDKADIILNYKDLTIDATAEEFEDINKQLGEYPLKRDTDVLLKTVDEIEKLVIGNNVLEVGCGKAYVSKNLSKKFSVTATDIILDKQLVKDNPSIKFKKANIEKLPFKNSSFDTVICNQTLEHVQNLPLAVSELKRVTAKRLIVVVPRQRSYRYTFDAHINFFPYLDTLIRVMQPNGTKYTAKDLNGELMYVEDKNKKAPSTKS